MLVKGAPGIIMKELFAIVIYDISALLFKDLCIDANQSVLGITNLCKLIIIRSYAWGYNSKNKWIEVSIKDTL